MITGTPFIIQAMHLSNIYPLFRTPFVRLTTSILTCNSKLLKTIIFPFFFLICVAFNALTRSFCYRMSRPAITTFPRVQRLSNLSNIRATRVTEGWSTSTEKKSVRF